MSIICVICEERFEPSDEIISTACGHIYHWGCFKMWVKKSATCPDCRNPLPDKSCYKKMFIKFSQEKRTHHQQVRNLKKRVRALKMEAVENKDLVDELMKRILKLQKRLKRKKICIQIYVCIACNNTLQLLSEHLKSCSISWEVRIRNQLILVTDLRSKGLCLSQVFFLLFITVQFIYR